VRKLLLATVLVLASSATHAAEEFDWGKYCGSKNEYCNPRVPGVVKWPTPSWVPMKKLFLSGIAALSVLSASAACADAISYRLRLGGDAFLRTL